MKIECSGCGEKFVRPSDEDTFTCSYCKEIDLCLIGTTEESDS